MLLVGGTDGGNAEILRHNAERHGGGSSHGARWCWPGTSTRATTSTAVLRAAGVSVTATANVLPEIGRLDPMPARLAIREVFIRHVIGGKGLSRRADFPAMVRAATPDAVLAGVEVLADGCGVVEGAGDVLVVDVGGATTDVYSVVTPNGEDAVLHKEVVEVLWRSRTVEGDLGVRWGATGVVEAACAERLLEPGEEAGLRAAAAARVADPAYLPDDDAGRDDDARLAGLAVTVALRRHGRGGQGPARGRPGRRLRRGAPARHRRAGGAGAGAGDERPRRRLGGAGARAHRHRRPLRARCRRAARRRAAADRRRPGQRRAGGVSRCPSTPSRWCTG